VKKSPTDKAALDTLVGSMAQRGDFQALYEGLQEVVEGIQDSDALAEFRSRLVEIVRKHLDAAGDAVLAANLKLRLAGLLYANDPKEALVLVAEAFERLPSEEVAQRAVFMLTDMKLALFVTQLLRQKAAAETGSERRADTLYQLGHAALASHDLDLAGRSFRVLSESFKGWADKAREGSALVASAISETEQQVTQLEAQLSSATDIERAVLKGKLGRKLVSLGRLDEGIPLLEEALDQNPGEELFVELAEAYKASEKWSRLAELVEQWTERVKDDEARRELLKERVRVFMLKLGDRKKGAVALDDLYKRYPGDPGVVEFCVNVFSTIEDFDALAALLGRARQDTRDRDQERRYLEWEAALKWRKLGDLEEAEKLYRRVKSIDPRNEPALLFYEEYCRVHKDYRKLYSVLSTRASLVPDSQKVRLLKAMADVAAGELAQPDRAIDSLKKVLVLDPGDEEAFERLASLLVETRRWHAVIEHYSARLDRLADEQSERRIDLLHRMLDIYENKDKLPVPEMVVTLHRRILQVDPQAAQSIDALEDYYRKNSRWGELIEVLERKAERESGNKEQLAIHKEIARILIEYQHQEQSAIPHLEQVVSLAPKDDEAVKLLARAYRTRGDFEKFFDLGKRQLASARGQDRKDLLEELSTIALERLSLEDEGADLLEKLFAADPKHPWAFRRLRQLYDKLERYDALCDLYGRAVEKSTGAAQRENRERLGLLLAEKLDRREEAGEVFRKLLTEDPNNRQVRQHLQRILAQSGEFGELLDMFKQEGNVPGLLRFLDEFRQKEGDLVRARAAGFEMVRLTREVLKDKAKQRQVLDSLLDQFQQDVELARMALEALPEGKPGLEAARPLSILAEHGEGEEKQEAALKLAEALEQAGETETAYTRTVKLFLEGARNGDLSLLQTVVDRAERSGSLEGMARLMVELLGDASPDIQERLALETASLFKVRMKDPARARQVLEDQLKRTPDSLEVLRELERLYMAASSWEDFERVVRAMADLTPELDARKVELHKLAQLYEEIVAESEKAAAVYRELRELDPSDLEAFAGLKRALEELESWEALAEVLEEELLVAPAEQVREDLLQLALLLDGKLCKKEAAAQTWERVLEQWPEDEDAWTHIRRLFDEGEALAQVLPLLEKCYETAEDWNALVEVLSRKAQVTEDDRERFDTLSRCAEILEDRLGRPDEAFANLVHMTALEPGAEGLLGRLERAGRTAGKLAGLAGVCRGLLSIGQSDFSAQGPLPEELDQPVALLLADLAMTLEDFPVAILALQRARVTSPSDLGLFGRLEELLDLCDRHADLLALLEEKRDYVWEEDEKRALYRQIADLLAGKLEREEDSIPWVEELHALAPQDEEVDSRLERLYNDFERWPELAALLQTRLARLEDEPRRRTTFQLALLHRDRLGDVESAFQLLADVIAQEPGNGEFVGALAQLLHMEDAQGFETVALKAASVLEPIAREAQDWVQLAEVLRARARLSPEPQGAATAWHSLGRLQADQLGDRDSGLESLALAVEADAGRETFVEDLVALGRETAAAQRVIRALATGIGQVETSRHLEALRALSQTLAESNADADLASRTLERLVELDVDDIENYWSLDALYSKAGKTGDRIRILSLAVERIDGRKRADVLVTLAQLQEDEGQRSDAVDSLTRAIDNPDLLDEDRRELAFNLIEAALQAEERWYDLTRTLEQRLRFVKDGEEKKGILFHLARVEEENLTNPDRAAAHYHAILDANPVEPAAFAALARILEAGGRHDALEDLLSTRSELVDDASEKHALLLRLAKVRLNDLANPDRAVDALGLLVEAHTASAEVVELLELIFAEHAEAGFRASQLLESVFEREERHEQLAEVYKAQIDRYPQEVDRVERYRTLAQLYEKQFKDTDAAFLYMSQAFKLEPTSESIHDGLVAHARERGSFDELFDIYLDVLVQLEEAEGRNNLRRKMVGIYHDELKDLEHAELIYRDMLDDEPGNPFAIERLQGLYAQQENWDRLVEVLRMKVEAAPSDKARIPVLYEVASVFREKTADLVEALDVYERILQLDSSQADAYRGIESIHFEQGDLQGVTATLRRELASRTTPEERREVQLRLAALLAGELEQFAEASDTLSEVLAAFPSDPQALEQLDEVVDRWDAPSPEAIGLLVDARTQASEWDLLVTLYQKLAGRAPNDEERIDWLEKIYRIRVESQQDLRGAFAATKIMLTIDPTAADRRQRLVDHALAVDETADLLEFLEGLLEHDRVAGAEPEFEIRHLLAGLYADRADDKAAAAAHFEAVAEGPLENLAADSRQRLRPLYQDLEAWDKYVALMEQLGAQSAEVPVRRACLLEAAQVAGVTLNDPDKAHVLLSSLVQELPDDPVVLERFESLLVSQARVDELEEFLSGRVDRTAAAEERGAIRFRLGNLLLSQSGRVPEGVGELLTALQESPGMAPIWVVLEHLAGSEETPDGERLRVAAGLEAAYPATGAEEKVRKILELRLALEEDVVEQNRIHLKLADLTQEGEPETAFLHCAQSLKMFPGVPEVEERLARLADSASVHADYRDVLTEVAELAGDDALLVRYLHQAAELDAGVLRNPEAAAATWERVLTVDEMDRTALAHLEEWYRGQEAWDRLAPILEKAIEVEDKADKRVARGLDLALLYRQNLGDVAKARTWFEEIGHEPQVREEVCVHLESIYRELEEWETLSDLLMQVKDEIEEAAGRRDVLLKLAYLNEEYLDNREEAFHRFGELLESHPEDLAALAGRRRCGLALEDWDAVARADEVLIAKGDAEQAPELRKELASILLERLGRKRDGLNWLAPLLGEPPLSESIRELAMSQLEDPEIGAEIAGLLEPALDVSDELEALVRLYETRLELAAGPEEKLPLVLKAIDVLSDRMGDQEKPFALAAGLLELAPSDTDLTARLERLAEKTGRWDRYVETLTGAFDFAGGTEQFLVLGTLLARACEERLGNPQAALEWSRRVLVEAPSDVPTIRRIEGLLDRLEQFEELARFYDAVALDFEGDQRGEFLLKSAFLKESRLSDPAGAVQGYRDVLSLLPDNQAALERLDAMLDNPLLALAAVEVLEPAYRQSGEKEKLARVLKVKATEVEGSLDRSQILAEAAQLMADLHGREAEAFETYLSAIRQKRFETHDILLGAERLAEQLDRWQDLASALEQVCADPGSDELKPDLLRRLALVYLEKMGNPNLSELKLREILHLDPDNLFALQLLSQVLARLEEPEEQLIVLARLGDLAVDSEQKKGFFLEAAGIAHDIAQDGRAADFYSQALRVAPDDIDAIRRLSDIYRKQGSFKELVELLERWAGLLDVDHAVELLLEAAQIARDRLTAPSRAMALCRQVLDRDEDNHDALLVMSDILRGQDRPQELAATLEKLAGMLQPEERVGIYWELKDLAVQTGDSEAAVGYLQKIIEIDPGNEGAVEAKLDLLRGGEDLYSLVATLEDQAKRTDDPVRRVELLYQAAVTLADEVGDPVAALERLRTLRELAPDNVQAIRKTAQILVQQHDFSAAVETWEELAKLVESPAEKGDCFRAAARVAINDLGDSERALFLARQALAAEPDSAEAADMESLALERLKRYEELTQTLLARVKKTQDAGRRAELSKQLAIAYRDGLGREDLFLSWTEEAHKAKEDPELVDEMLRHYRKQDNMQRVAPLLEWRVSWLTQRKQLKEVPVLLFELAQARKTLGQPDEALHALARCLDIDASFLPALFLSASLRFEQGQADEALPLFQNLLLRINELESREQKIAVYMSLARINIDKGDKKKAKTFLTRLLSLDRNHPEAKELLGTL
jgi:tetratricopeptide (TPR) repeat protein